MNVIRALLRTLAWTACALGTLLHHLTAQADEFFLGEVEVQINGQLVKHSRAWRCVEQTVFRPANNSLFERELRQTPAPANAFVIKRFGQGGALVFENWRRNCRAQVDSGRSPMLVDILDSLESPTYGEQLYLFIGANDVVHNPFEPRFRVRLLKNQISRIDEDTFKTQGPTDTSEGMDLLFLLRQTVDRRLQVDMLTWRDGERLGIRQGLATNKDRWQVPQSIPPRRQSPTPEADTYDANHRINRSYIPLALAREPKRINGVGPVQVQLGQRTLTLDDRGFAEVERPEPGITRVRFYGSVEGTSWSSMCIAASSRPDCPPPPARP